MASEKYPFWAVDKHGQLIDFVLADRRNTRAAYRFLRKAFKTMSACLPSSITTDKLASYPKALRRLQKESLLSKNVKHRTSKYLNITEADHGALKRLIQPTRGFQRMRTASATLKGFEVMRMIRRGHFVLTQHDKRNPSREPALRSCRLSAPVDWVRCARSKLMQRSRLWT